MQLKCVNNKWCSPDLMLESRVYNFIMSSWDLLNTQFGVEPPSLPGYSAHWMLKQMRKLEYIAFYTREVLLDHAFVLTFSHLNVDVVACIK